MCAILCLQGGENVEIGDRLKEIRKTLGLTQAEFGEKMGLKPTAIGQMESGARNITDRTYILLQEKYNVNIEYLQGLSGEMFVSPTTFSLDEYAKSKELKEMEINLIRGFMELDPNVRNALYDMFKNAFSNEPSKNTNSLYEECPKTPEELEKNFPPVRVNKENEAI